MSVIAEVNDVCAVWLNYYCITDLTECNLIPFQVGVLICTHNLKQSIVKWEHTFGNWELKRHHQIWQAN